MYCVVFQMWWTAGWGLYHGYKWYPNWAAQTWGNSHSYQKYSFSYTDRNNIPATPKRFVVNSSYNRLCCLPYPRSIGFLVLVNLSEIFKISHSKIVGKVYIGMIPLFTSGIILIAISYVICICIAVKPPETSIMVIKSTETTQMFDDVSSFIQIVMCNSLSVPLCSASKCFLSKVS